MLRKTITVTEQQEKWIKTQIDIGEYGNDSEYLRDLIRQDKKQKEIKSQLQLALIAGEQSGLSNKKLETIFSKLKEEYK